MIQLNHHQIIIDNIQKRKQILKDFTDFKRYLLAFDTDIDETIQTISELLPTTSLTPANQYQEKIWQIQINDGKL